MFIVKFAIKPLLNRLTFTPTKTTIMKTSRIKKYSTFYLHYLNEHSKKNTRVMHFVGTLLFLLFLLLAISNSSILAFSVGVLIVYGFAWLSHYVVEQNKPATFQYPIWSLLSDFRLCFEILIGKQSFVGKAMT
mgnify:CR=1 FL=1